MLETSVWECVRGFKEHYGKVVLISVRMLALKTVKAFESPLHIDNDKFVTILLFIIYFLLFTFNEFP